MNIIARRPKGDGYNEYIVVDRGPGHDCRWVSASANAHSLKGGEWYSGFYFKTQGAALSHFKERG
jgi:hypothetical protein